MTPCALHRDESGAAAVEFSLTAPLFVLLLFGLMQVAFWIWAATALQHGADAAARCASVNRTICPSQAAIEAYAARHALGLPVSASAFTATQAACGNQVSATFSYLAFTTRLGLPSLAITARACHPV